MKEFLCVFSKAVMLAVLSVLIVSCGKNADPMTVLERYVVEEVQERYGDKMSLVSIEKINGQKGEVLGVETYVIEYESVFESNVGVLHYIEKYAEYKHVKGWKPSDSQIENNIGGRSPIYPYPVDTLEIVDDKTLEGLVIGRFEVGEDYGHRVPVNIFRIIKSGSTFSKKGKETLRKSDNGWIVD